MRRMPPSNAKARKDLVAALLADAAMAVQRSRLGDAIRVRGDRHAREQEAEALDDVAAFAGDEPVRRGQHVDRRLPVDDPRIDGGRARFAHQAVRTIRGAFASGWRMPATRIRRAGPGAAACANRRGRTGRWRAPAPQRARAPRPVPPASCRRSPHNRNRRPRGRWPSRPGRCSRHRAARHSCARHRTRTSRRPSAATSSRRDSESGGRSAMEKRSASGIGGGRWRAGSAGVRGAKVADYRRDRLDAASASERRDGRGPWGPRVGSYRKSPGNRSNMRARCPA